MEPEAAKYMVALSGTIFAGGGADHAFVRPGGTCWHVCLWVRPFHLFFLSGLSQLLGKLESVRVIAKKPQGTKGAGMMASVSLGCLSAFSLCTEHYLLGLE